MKKLIAAVSTVFIAVALSIVAVAGPASAHTATLSGTAVCNAADGSATVTWTIDNDYNELLNVTASNNLASPVGTTVAATGGGSDTTQTFTQTIAAPAAGQTATATVSFLWSGDNFTQNGTKATSNKVSTDCKVPTPKDAAAALVFTPATCSAPEGVAEGATTFASWAAAITLSGPGSLHYSATANSTSGHLFPGGSNTLTLHGDLDPKLTGIDCQPRVCIPDSAVSYHYNANDNNDGYIIVTDVPHSTGVLCNPFWVTATSWTFTNNSSVWPQNRDVVDKLPEISTPGTYDFAAKVTCGQGDIYASTDANAPSLNPGPVLNGPSNPFVEHFLSDMGFTGSTSPTYTQDNASCYIPIPETGTPTSTVLSCTPNSSNSLTLPAVLGGVWTVTSAHYNHTYGIGTGVTGFTPTFFEQYTIVLTDGSSADGYVVTGNTNTWTPVNPRHLDCNTVTTPATPTAVSIEKCGDAGSITIPDTAGVVYSLDGTVVPAGTITGLTGDHTVTAAPAANYEFTKDATTKWKFKLHDEKTCPVAIVLDTCTADGSVSSVPVSVTLDNSSGSTSSSFEVKIVGTAFDQTFVVAKHTTVTESIGSSSTAGETVDVFVNGSSTAVVLTVNKFDGCVPVTPGDPTFTTLSCTGTTTNLGSISTDGNPELIYTLNGPGNTNVTFPTHPVTPTISGLAAGTYTVSVTAEPGFILSGADSFPVTIPLPQVNCVGTQQTPVVTFVAPTCEPNPENIQSTQFNATLAEVQGTITIPTNANMTFTIYNGTTTSPITAGTYVEPDGTYTVVATLTSTAIADGYTFGPSAGYITSVGDTVATFTPIVFTSTCGLPTLASWHSGATGSDAVCTSTGASGTITVVHGSDLAHPTDENGKVTYTLVNNGNGHTTNLGSTALTVNVAPGNYTVEAVPTDPADGLVGNPNVTNEIDYPVLVGAPAGSCGDLLAFTGGTIAWGGFVLAGGMLFLGFAFLLIRRRGKRTAE
jgi:hypothetical protein